MLLLIEFYIIPLSFFI